MTKLMGNGEGMTAVLLTDAESGLMRKQLTELVSRNVVSERAAQDMLAAFNRGIQRGTERLQAEFTAEQRERKAKKAAR